MDDIPLSSPLALALYALVALVLAAVLWKLPVPYREKRMAVGALLVLFGVIPTSCGLCGMLLVGFSWQSILILGVIVAIGMAAALSGGRMFLAAVRYREEPPEQQRETLPAPPSERTE